MNLAPATFRQLHGKYRIVAELGQGGTSRVWLAVARGPSGFSKLVVLKTMKSELSSEAELALLFMNEARLAARLNHPNIVQTNEVFEHDGLPVIVMEYLDGQPLSAILARDREDPAFPLSLQIRVLSEALEGLHSAHELADFDGTPLGVVHRDVSPHNVFVTYDGNVKMIDFGIAKLIAGGEVTESGVIKGKLHYMSPEQIAAGPVDRRADVYSAGIILWEMAAGERMWRGLNEAVVMNRILNGELPRLVSTNPNADPYLQELIDRATAVSPNARYPSAADFQLDLDEYLAARDPNLRARDVGGAVARMFGDKRKERRSIIESELSRVLSLSDDEYLSAELPALPILEREVERQEFTRRQERKKRRQHLLPWLVVVLLAAVVVVLLLRPVEPPEVIDLPPAKSEAEPVAGQSPGQSGSAKEEEVVLLRVTAFPAHAKMALDGVTLPGNPHLGSFPLDAKNTRTLVVTADGYVTTSVPVILGRDQDLVLALEKKKADRPRPPKVVTEPDAAPAPPGVPAPGDPCDPPFFVDARGVKRYKPGCL